MKLGKFFVTQNFEWHDRRQTNKVIYGLAKYIYIKVMYILFGHIVYR